MKLKVSSKNEFYFYPDVQDNLEKQEQDRFAIVVKKVNLALEGASIYQYDENYKLTGIDNLAKLKLHIKELRNAPMLEIGDTEEREMKIDDLLSGDFPELYSIVSGLNNFIINLDAEGVDTKKS